MYLEFIVGPLVALAVGMKFTVYKNEETIKDMQAKIEELQSKNSESVAEMEKEIDQNLAKKMLLVLKPVATEVQKVKDAVGV